MKTFTDEILELCEKATPGPWHSSYIGSIHDQDGYPIDTGGPDCEIKVAHHNSELLARSRTLLPECARRLDAAVLRLKEATHFLFAAGLLPRDQYEDEIKYITNELERPLDGK